MITIAWAEGLIFVVIFVLAFVGALAGSRHFRVVLGVLGAAIGAIAAVIAVSWATLPHSRTSVLVTTDRGGVNAPGDKSIDPDAPNGSLDPAGGSASEGTPAQAPASAGPGNAAADGSRPLAEQPESEVFSDGAGGDPDGRSAPRERPPAWLNAPTGKQRDGSYHLIVKSGPFKTRMECDKELGHLVAQEVDGYVKLLLGGDAIRRAMGDRFRGSTLLTASELQGLVRETWQERVKAAYPVGEMVSVHALVAITPPMQRLMESRFHERVGTQRAGQAAVASGGLLGLLAIVYGYLRLDTLTRGYYTRRLRLAAAAMILGVVGGTAAYFLA